MTYSLIYADDFLVVINKPAGLLSIPDRYDASKPNVLAQLRADYGDIYTVHRLDRETSGILCFARTEAAHRHLNQQFQDRQTKKIYTALVEGQVRVGTHLIEKPIGPHPTQNRMMITAKGKASTTAYWIKEQFKHFAWIECEILTGRMHQIRVHLESVNLPLLVDSIYGRREAFFLSSVKGKKYRRGKFAEERPLMSRTTLHAYRLEFKHPQSGENQVFEAEPPKDFRAVVNQLRKWGK